MCSGFQVIVLLVLASVLAVKAKLRNGNDNGNDIHSTMDEVRGQIFPRDVSRSALAVRLCRVVEDGYKDDIDTIVRDNGFDPSDGIYFESGIDAAYLTRIGDEYCAAAFRGTTNYQVGDWMTNVDLDPITFNAIKQSNNNTVDTALKVEDCEVHHGYHDAYTRFEYREKVDKFLSDCRAECVECETILTGYSQGGGIAAIAALDFKAKTLNENVSSPYIITFGAPQSLGAPCAQHLSESEKQRWFRYIMSRKGLSGGLVYDPIPFVYPSFLDPSEDQKIPEEGFWENFVGYWDVQPNETYARKGGLAYIGHEILLSTEDASSVLLSKYNGHRAVDFNFFDLTILTHFLSEYEEVFEAQNEIYNNDNFKHCLDGENGDAGISNVRREILLECALPSSGFAVGTICNPGESNLLSTCADGTFCKEDTEDWFWEPTTCQPLPLQKPTILPVGSFCDPDESELLSICADGTVCEADEKDWFWQQTTYSCQRLRLLRMGSVCDPDDPLSICADWTGCEAEEKDWFWQQTMYSCK